jgi:hypothetical protein
MKNIRIKLFLNLINKGGLIMYRDTLNEFMIYFWVVTDWGILWLSIVLSYFILKGVNK